jgi:MAF protein
MANLILASNSPRRRELITLLEQPTQSTGADIDETPRAGEDPRALARRLCEAKARAVAQTTRDLPRDALIIAADTFVALDDEILMKPRDADDAVAMLMKLRGREHLVISGLAVLDAATGRVGVTLVETRVWMRDYADAEIRAYVATGDPLDKAAAYAIQHPAFSPVARLEGCYANVMGLPLCHLYVALRRFGAVVSEPDARCQRYLQIACPVAREILKGSL